MTNLVPKSDIEHIVGAKRGHFYHLGRAVSSEGAFYILHSQECLDSGIDLRQCDYSLALDEGVEVVKEDVTLLLWLSKLDAMLHTTDNRRSTQ